jgi:hypothetical protein
MLWRFTPDASVFMHFHFWQLILYASDDIFPSAFPKNLGRIFGIACGVGDVLTYQVLAEDTQEILFR